MPGEQDTDPGTRTEPGPALVWAFSRIASALLSELRMNSHPVSSRVLFLGIDVEFVSLARCTAFSCTVFVSIAM